MAEIGKLLNYLGFSVFMLGIIANINSLISLALASVGFVWAIIRAFRELENYRIRKIERMEREDAFHRKLKQADDYSEEE